MNGTIKQINLNRNGQGLKQRLLSDKNSLICIFEEIFGYNKAPQYEGTAGIKQIPISAMGVTRNLVT